MLGGLKMLLKKSEFLKRYGPRDTPMSQMTYHRRMKELKETPFFSDAYQEVTSNEIYIDTEMYDEYIRWRSHNRRKGTKYIEPLEWLKGVRQSRKIFICSESSYSVG